MPGSKPGERRGGRQAGAPNRRTAQRQEAMQEAAARIAQAIGTEAFAGDAHALLIAVYKDPAHEMELRVDAAKAAIRFEKPTLASSTVEVRDPLATMSVSQLEALHRMALLAVAGEDHAHVG